MRMARLSKEALLSASDLVEREVELPSIGGSVKVKSLPASYSNHAQSEALTMKQTTRGEQFTTVDTDKMEILQVLHGLLEPKLNSEQEARTFAQRCGPAFKEVVKVIDEISGIDKEAIEDANARFQAGGEGASNGREAGADAPSAGSGGPDLPARTGAGAR